MVGSGHCVIKGPRGCRDNVHGHVATFPAKGERITQPPIINHGMINVAADAKEAGSDGIAYVGQHMIA